MRLKHPRNDLVEVGSRGSRDQPIYLPPELCQMVKGQRYVGKLSGAQTAAMIKFAVKSPSDNARAISIEGLDVLGISPRDFILLDNRVFF